MQRSLPYTGKSNHTQHSRSSRVTFTTFSKTFSTLKSQILDQNRKFPGCFSIAKSPKHPWKSKYWKTCLRKKRMCKISYISTNICIFAPQFPEYLLIGLERDFEIPYFLFFHDQWKPCIRGKSNWKRRGAYHFVS